jgi:small subunit ribosomal protein S19e
VFAEALVSASACGCFASGLQLQIPDWVDIVKTATFKELPPQDKDWYYIRAGGAGSRTAAAEGWRGATGQQQQQSGAATQERGSPAASRQTTAGARGQCRSARRSGSMGDSSCCCKEQPGWHSDTLVAAARTWWQQYVQGTQLAGVPVWRLAGGLQFSTAAAGCAQRIQACGQCAVRAACNLASAQRQRRGQLGCSAAAS